MSLNFINKLTKDKTRHTITNIRSNQNILLTQLKNFLSPTTALSRQRSKSKNNYSTKNIYKSHGDKKEKSCKEKDEIIKKLKERVKELENKIKFLEFKVKKLLRMNSNCPTSSKNSKNHSISGKENLNDKKEFKSINVPKKNIYLKTGYNKKRTSSQLLTEENINDIKERCNTIFINSINNKSKSKSKNKKKADIKNEKIEKKKQLNTHNINEILKKAIMKKTHLRKNSKLNNLKELDLKISISKLMSKIPKTSRHHYQTESNVNLSSKITSSTTFNCYKQNNSNNYSDNNNVLTSNNNIYTEEGDMKEDYTYNNTITNTNRNNYNINDNEKVKHKLNQIKVRTAHLLELFTGLKINDM
jgi:hypothetical protein